MRHSDSRVPHRRIKASCSVADSASASAAEMVCSAPEASVAVRPSHAWSTVDRRQRLYTSGNAHSRDASLVPISSSSALRSTFSWCSGPASTESACVEPATGTPQKTLWGEQRHTHGAVLRVHTPGRWTYAGHQRPPEAPHKLVAIGPPPAASRLLLMQPCALKDYADRALSAARQQIQSPARRYQ